MAHHSAIWEMSRLIIVLADPVMQPLMDPVMKLLLIRETPPLSAGLTTGGIDALA